MIGSSTRTITRTSLMAAMAIFMTTLSVGVANAQDNSQKNKNNWRNIAIGAAGVSALGFLKNDKTVGFVGAAGALYSLNRYEQDRKSQSKASAARAAVFSHASIYKNGHKYNRQLVNRNGKKYYRFVRA